MNKTQKTVVYLLVACVLAAMLYMVFGKVNKTSESQADQSNQADRSSHQHNHDSRVEDEKVPKHHDDASHLGHVSADTNVELNTSQMEPVNTPDTVAPDTVKSTIGRFGVSAPDISNQVISAEQNAEQLMLATCASNPDVMASAIAEYKEDYGVLLRGFGIKTQCEGSRDCEYIVDEGGLLKAFESSGLKRGDQVTNINNISVNDITSADDFLQLFNFKSANTLTVSRAGQDQLIELNCSNPELSSLPSYTDPTNPAKK